MIILETPEQRLCRNAGRKKQDISEPDGNTTAGTFTAESTVIMTG